jgi:hypothetical protein
MKKNVNKNEKTFQQFQQFPIKKNVNKKVKQFNNLLEGVNKNVLHFNDFLQRKTLTKMYNIINDFL